MNRLTSDLRYAVRQLIKTPAFTVFAILILAFGIGTNTAIFSTVNGWLRPLPVRDPEQITIIAAQQKDDSLGIYYLSYPALVDVRQQAGDSFSDLFAYQLGFGGLNVDGKSNSFAYSYVTGNYFSVLGLKPALGRLFLPNEGEQPNAAPAMVLGYSYWQKRFAGDPTVLGKQVKIDGKPTVIIGVAPKGFHGVYSVLDMGGYLPLSMMAQEDRWKGMWDDRSQRVLAVLGRLRPAVSRTQAQASLNVIAQRLALQYPKTDAGISVRAVPERLARPIPQLASATPLIAGLFLILAGCVLLLACMNVANLMLVRANARQREMSVRAALGASRTLLIQQVLAESVLLALLSGALGVLLGNATTGLIASMRLGTRLPVLMDFSFDWRVFAYAMAMALITGVVVGLWPAMRVTHGNLNAALQEDGGRGGSGGVGRHRLRNILVVVQVAGSLMLLIVAARFVRSLQQAQHMSLGFDPDNVLNVMLDPSQAGYNQAQTTTFYRELKHRLASLPGVQSVSVAFAVPMGNYNDGSPVYLEDRPLNPEQQPPLVFLNRIDPDYFEVSRVALLRGRKFTDFDVASAPAVAIINQAMAARFWPQQDPIGKRFHIKTPTGPIVEIVGIAGDSKLFGYYSGPIPYFYLPFEQDFTAARIVQVRSSMPPDLLTTEIQQQVQALDPEMPVSDVQTMKEVMAGGNGFLTFRLGAILTAAMGLLGLMIGIVGIYGVVSSAANQRKREIGIRMAVGANHRNILSMVLGEGVRLVFIGCIVGLMAAFGLTRLMINFLVGVTVTDPVTVVPVALLLVGIALIACYVPARRAMRTDPIVALRND